MIIHIPNDSYFTFAFGVVLCCAFLLFLDLSLLMISVARVETCHVHKVIPLIEGSPIFREKVGGPVKDDASKDHAHDILVLARSQWV